MGLQPVFSPTRSSDFAHGSTDKLTKVGAGKRAHARRSLNAEGGTRWPLAKESATILRENIIKSTYLHSPVTKIIAKISDVQLLLQTFTPIFGFQVRSHEQ